MIKSHNLIVKYIYLALTFNLFVTTKTFGKFNNIHSNGPLKETLCEMLNGPLKHSSLMFMVDKNLYLEDDLTFITTCQNSPKYIVVVDKWASWATLLNHKNDSELKYVTVVFILGSFYEWLDDDLIPWKFRTVLIVSANPSLTMKIVKSKLIQRARNVAIIEEPNENNSVAVYASRPMERDQYLNRQYKFFLDYWKQETFPTFSDLFMERFQSFGGEILHVSSDDDDFPFVTKGENRKQTGGLTFQILDSLSAVLNFSYTTTKSAADHNWGDKINDTWNGLLGAVFRREKNISTNNFALTYERAEDFDISYPYFYEGFGFALRIPLPLPPWLNLIHPLNYKVWIAIAVIIILAPIIFHFLINQAYPRIYRYSLVRIYMDIYKSLLKQNLTSYPRTAVGRTCYLFWGFGVLLIAVSYTGNLVAVLTIPVFPSMIRTLEALAHSNLRVGMADYGEFVPDALKTSDDTILKSFGKKLVLYSWEKRNDSSCFDEILEKSALSERVALLEHYSYLVKAVRNHYKAKYLSYMLKEQIYTGPLTFFYTKNSPWHERFNDPMSRLFEGGIIIKWYSDLMQKKDKITSSSKGGSTKALTMHHLQGPFIIITFGFCVSVMCFLFEFGLLGR